MDYLLCDSFFCGVEYGKFDFECLLEMVVLIVDFDIGFWGFGVYVGGVYVFEVMVFVCYYMFMQVYFNIIGKVFEFYFGEWLCEEEVFWSSEFEVFFEFDDMMIFLCMCKLQMLYVWVLFVCEYYVVVCEIKEYFIVEEKKDFEE